jgi:polysaccharide pyruvyl transferase WcaK-like protein
MRVGVFNVKYSPNLGDGLLSECLEAELVRAVPGLSIASFDLAGRTDYGAGGRFRGAALSLLQSSPTPVRQRVASLMLGRAMQRLAPTWRERLADVDVAVTGGGNLFSDADLNFPLKIDAACKLLREADIPVAVFAVGVSDNWTEKGEALFQRALAGARVLDASVRDARSATVWDRRLGHTGVPRARIVRDPGLLVSFHVERARRAGTAKRIGLGLTHPTTLRYHSDETAVGEAELTGWYTELVRGCLARGWEVCVFTNGSSEDEAYLRKMRPLLAPLGTGISFAPRFTRPAELAAYVSGLDLLMAHRLHANIAAYSYAVPQIGFTWDAKLKSFFDLVGRGDCICTAGRESPAAVLNLAERCLAEGIDPERHRRVLAAARDDVVSLASALVAGVEAGRMRVPARAIS